jgi:hypothetical protein
MILLIEHSERDETYYISTRKLIAVVMQKYKKNVLVALNH